jgi:putative FmdB family regulatory protein
MPLYEYECDACHQRFEVIQKKFSDPAPEHCARCGKGPVHRLQSTPAIQFKGSGWYITDYAGGRSNSASSTSSSDGEAKSESKKDGETKTAGEAPAAKSDSASGSSGTTASSPTKTGGASSTKDKPSSTTKD